MRLRLRDWKPVPASVLAVAAAAAAAVMPTADCPQAWCRQVSLSVAAQRQADRLAAPQWAPRMARALTMQLTSRQWRCRERRSAESALQRVQWQTNSSDQMKGEGTGSLLLRSEARAAMSHRGGEGGGDGLPVGAQINAHE